MRNRILFLEECFDFSPRLFFCADFAFDGIAPNPFAVAATGYVLFRARGGCLKVIIPAADRATKKWIVRYISIYAGQIGYADVVPRRGVIP